MTRFLATLAFLIALACPAAAQNVTCPDVPPGDSSNRCANTRFVQNNGGGGTSTLTLNHIFIGNSSNVATDTAMTGDCTIAFAGGAITCFATPLPTAKGGLGVNASGASGVPLFLAGAATFVLTNGTGNFVRASGAAIASATISGSAWTGGTITGLPTCSASSDACPKSYIDSVSGGNTPLAPVRLATVAVLSNTPTYANGAAGVGATLTAGSNGALSVDGTVVNLNDRVLVKDQAAQLQNGPYSLTTLGTGGVPYVLTRTTDADTAAELPNRLTMLVTGGATLGGSSWTLNQSAAITVGTTALPFVQTSSPSVSYWTLTGSDISKNNAGNVGIGTTAPATALDISRAIAAGTDNYLLTLRNPTAAVTDLRVGLKFQVNSLAAQYGPTIHASNDGVTGAGNTIFGNFINNAWSEKMRLSADGNLGLGSTAPGYLLHLNRSVGGANAVGSSIMLGRNSDNIFGGAIWDSNDGSVDYMSLGAGWGIAPTSNPLLTLKPSTFAAVGGAVGIGTVAPDTTRKLDVLQGTVGAPVTTVANSVKITRNEQLASPNDTQGAQNAALNVESFGNNVSVVGVNIAQPVGIRGYAKQSGSGDAVGAFFVGENSGTGTYAAFGVFATAVAHTSTTGAIAFGGGTGNDTGVSRTWSPGGPWLFGGIDLPYTSYGTANKGEVAALVRKTDVGAWSCGFCIATGAVADWAYYSANFTVDSVGNEVALTNTAISDERLKNIHGPFTKGLAEILQINPIFYNWKDNPDQPRQAGVSAQDVQRSIPEAVSEIDADGHLGVSDRPLVAALINSVKELKAANDNLKACQASWRCRIFGP